MLTIGVNANNAASVVFEGTKTMQKDSCHGGHKAMGWGLLLMCSFSILVKFIGPVLFRESQAVVERTCLFGALLVGMILPRLKFSWRDQAAKLLQPIRASGRRGAESPHVASTKEKAAAETTEAASKAQSSPNTATKARSSQAQADEGSSKSSSSRCRSISVETVQQMLDTTSGIDAGDLAQGIAACCESGNSALAETWLARLLGLAPSDLKAVSMAHVHRISEAAIRAGCTRKVAGWLWQLQTAGIPSHSETLLSVLDSLVAINEIARAEQLLSQMEAANAELDSECFELLFEHCIPLASTENVARATMWLQRIGRRGPSHLAKGFAAIIRARGSPLIGLERTAEEAIKAEIDRAQQAEFWMNRALAAGVTRSTQCYNAVIEACARIDIAKAEMWLEHMEKAAKEASGDASGDSMTHFGPDVYSYSMVMDTYAQRGETDKAEAFSARMQAACVKADAMSFESGSSSTP